MEPDPMITLVMPYYMNYAMLSLHYRNFQQWPSKVRKAIRIVIVDDGSPLMPAANVPRPYDMPVVEIYRVLMDKPWHQHGARNLGAHVATTEWLLLTDMDHLLEPEAASRLVGMALRGSLDPGSVYMHHRIEGDTREPTRAPNGVLKPHPNTFTLTRDLFWQIGGYDERATGIYGTDKLFRARAFSIGQQAFLDDVPLVRYWRDLVPDASTTTLPRKEGRDPAEKARIMREIAAAPDARKVLDFDWEQVL